MSLHLAEIARMVEPGRHAVLLPDQAGWHLSADPEVPANITVLPLPAKCPELNVMENVWQLDTSGNRLTAGFGGVQVLAEQQKAHRRLPLGLMCFVVLYRWMRGQDLNL